MRKIYLCSLFFLICLGSSKAQQSSLQEMLWNNAGGKPSDVSHYGGETKIVDDSANGYLQIETIEEGCGCYYKTNVGAYEQSDNSYMFLKMEYDGCNWRKNLAATPRLISVLPKNFELPEFLTEEAKKEYKNNSSFPIFYLEATIPQQGTDTKIDLAYIPFGVRLSNRNDVLALTGYSELNNEGKSNYTYSGDLSQLLHAIQDENTLHALLKGTFDNINSVDYDVVDKFCGKDKTYASIEDLAKELRDLKVIYQFSKQIAYKSIILGWNSQKGRFFIKEKIKNDALELSFLEFIKELPFLMAVC